MAIESDSKLDRAFAALSDPTRRAILGRLAMGEATVAELGAPFAISQPTVSKHLKVLEAAGLIEGGRDAQRRPRRLRADALQEASGWLDALHETWTRRLGNLDAHLNRQREKEKK